MMNLIVSAFAAGLLAALVPVAGAQSTSDQEEERKAIVRRVHDELFGNADTTVLDEYFAEDYVEHHVAAGTLGREDLRRMYGSRGVKTTFPDLHNEIEALLYDDDQVVVRLTATGTMKGPMGDQAPTGRSFTLPVIVIYRFEGEQIVEAWRSYNVRSLRQQIGVD
jgi:predicted ester cyclase